MTQTVLIIDFGSQVTQLIARRLREQGTYCEIVPFQSAEAYLKKNKPTAIILSGSPASTTDVEAPLAPQAVFEMDLPVLGICYGEQLMCAQLGGKVEAGHHREFGRATLEVTETTPLFDGDRALGGHNRPFVVRLFPRGGPGQHESGPRQPAHHRGDVQSGSERRRIHRIAEHRQSGDRSLRSLVCGRLAVCGVHVWVRVARAGRIHRRDRKHRGVSGDLRRRHPARRRLVQRQPQ